MFKFFFLIPKNQTRVLSGSKLAFEATQREIQVELVEVVDLLLFK